MVLDLTGEHIAELNDSDLRSLVGRLCESDLEGRGLCPSAVTSGGNQDAADGGLDVRVALPVGTAIGGFIPRAVTGFQVKKPDLPPSKILDEMRPKGTLRPVIAELAENNGSYIIATAASTTGSALANRRRAMKEAIEDLPNKDLLSLDFYDRGKLASWTRLHPGLVLWVRERIGKPIHGWRAYGVWAYDPGGVTGEYLLDEKVRIHGAGISELGVPALEGLRRLRDRLNKPGTVVRLVGLSGVGKTRFVQALFDGRLGENGVDPSLAVYANVADDPVPAPSALISELVPRIEGLSSSWTTVHPSCMRGFQSFVGVRTPR